MHNVGVSAKVSRADRCRLKSSHAEFARIRLTAEGVERRSSLTPKRTAGNNTSSNENETRRPGDELIRLQDVFSKKILRSAARDAYWSFWECTLTPSPRHQSDRLRWRIPVADRSFANATNVLRLSIGRGPLNPPKTAANGLQFGSTFK